MRWKVPSLLVFLMLTWVSLCGQETASFQLSNRQLGSNMVYDLHMLDDGSFVAATDHGVALITMGGVKMLTNRNAIRNSYTNIREDASGRIYAQNFRNQIYEVKEDSLVLILDLTKDFEERVIDYHFWSKTIVAFSYKSLRRYDLATGKPMESWNKRVDRQLEALEMTLGAVDTDEERSLFFGNATLKSDTILWKPIVEARSSGIRYYERDNRRISIRTSIGLVFLHSEGIELDCRSVLEGAMLQNIGYTDSHFWVATNRGLLLYDPSFEDTTAVPLFTGTSISQVEQDLQGNYWVGTLGQGILVVPSVEITKFEATQPEHGNFSSLAAIPGSDSLFAATMDGHLYSIGPSDRIHYLSAIPVRELYDLCYENEGLYIASSPGVMRWQEGVTHQMPSSGIAKNIQLFNHHLMSYSWYSSSLISLESSADVSNSIPAFTVLSPSSRDGTLYSAVPFEQLWARKDGTYMLGASLGRCKRISESGITYLDSLNGRPFGVADIYSDDQNHGYVLDRAGAVYIIDSNSLQLQKVVEFRCTEIPERLIVKGDKFLVYSNGDVLYMDRFEQVQHQFKALVPFNFDDLVDIEVTNNYLWLAYSSTLYRIPFSVLKTEASHLLQPLSIQGTPNVEDAQQLPADLDPVRIALNYTDVLVRHQLKCSYKLNDGDWIFMDQLTNVLTLSNLAAGDYHLSVRIHRGVSTINERSLSFSIAPRWYETKAFIGLIVFSVFGGTVVFFRGRIRAIQKQNKVRQKLNEAQHTALKAQMNPHFLFNVLNSMQTMVLKEDKVKANKIMSELSTFVRKILHYSGEAYIPFEDELEMLQNYLKLEKHRFSNDFNYEIIVGQELETRLHMLIPPMLVQPFVENAINHGLLHKKEDRRLSVAFNCKDEVLICTIEDNGVGRKQAAALREKSKKHRSFASGASARRISLLKDAGHKDVGIDIDDLYHHNQQPAGTRVTVRMPLTQPS